MMRDSSDDPWIDQRETGGISSIITNSPTSFTDSLRPFSCHLQSWREQWFLDCDRIASNCNEIIMQNASIMINMRFIIKMITLVLCFLFAKSDDRSKEIILRASSIISNTISIWTLTWFVFTFSTFMSGLERLDNLFSQPILNMRLTRSSCKLWLSWVIGLFTRWKNQ